MSPSRSPRPMSERVSGKPTSLANSEHLHKEGTEFAFQNQLNEHSIGHFLPMKELVRGWSGREAVVDRMGGSQARRFKAKPREQSVRFHQAFQGRCDHPRLDRPKRLGPVVEQRLVAEFR